MKVVTWNCRGNFSKKFRKIRELDADVYVIQECECPRNSKDNEYRDFAEKCLWRGDGQRGLGIFVKKGNELREYDLDEGPHGYFIMCFVNHTFKFIGAWVQNDEKQRYAPVALDFLKKHAEEVTEDVIVAGDLNLDLQIKGLLKSSKSQTQEFYDVLESKGLVSSYHSFFNEEYGKEKYETYYRYGHLNEPSTHIDYIFIKKSKIKNVELGNPEVWVRLSDHVPLVLDLK